MIQGHSRRTTACRWSHLLAGLGLAAIGLAGGPLPGRAGGNSAAPDSLPTDSASFDSLAARMSRSWLTRPFSQYIFQPAAAPLQEQAVAQPGVDFFTPYRGQVIRRINVLRLDVFADASTRTEGTFQHLLESFGQALHADTREGVVRKYFLIQEGDRLDPDAVADTERLLRGTSFLREAEIVPLPVEGSADSVDLIVVTRDQWSLGLDLKVKSSSRADLRIADRNFGGWGHTLQGEFQFDNDLRPQVGTVGSYRVDNIRGWFVRNTYEFRRTARETSGRFGLVRERLAPQILTTGALDLAVRDLVGQAPLDPPRSFLESHVWLGRAFPVGPAPPGGVSRSAIVLAGAFEGLDFWKRPDSVTVDFNRGFSDRFRWLSSLSFSRSEFRKGRLLYTYGRTEDVPEGLLATITGGVESGEFTTRGYGSGALRAGKYAGWAYFEGGAAIGAFLGDNSWEDGVLDLSGRWISELLAGRGYGLREFVDVQYTYGFARRFEDRIFISDDAGLDQLRGSVLNGRGRLLGGLESVLFTPWNPLGFRFALFGKWSAGTVGPAADSFLHGAYYSTLGFGVRIHNAHLILDPLELRFTFAVRKPVGSSIEALDFGNLGAPRFPGFDPGPPAVTEYR